MRACPILCLALAVLSACATTPPSEITNVRFAAAKTEVENAAGITQYRVDDPKPSGSFGVLLLDAIPSWSRPAAR